MKTKVNEDIKSAYTFVVKEVRYEDPGEMKPEDKIDIEGIIQAIASSPAVEAAQAKTYGLQYKTQAIVVRMKSGKTFRLSVTKEF